MAEKASSIAGLVAETTVPTSTLTPQPTGKPPNPRAPPSSDTGKQQQQEQPQQNDVVVEMAPASAADDDALVTTLTEIVNAAYLATEGSIFVEGYARTNLDELRGFIRDGELAAAYLASSATANIRQPRSTGTTRSGPGRDGAAESREVVGCIRIQHLSPTLGEFAMLALHSSYRGGGMGRRMVRFAEEHCLGLGMDTMQLELLVPKGFEHAFKKRLHGWYSRMGYEIVRMGSFQEEYPHLASLLRGPCEYRIYQKKLV